MLWGAGAALCYATMNVLLRAAAPDVEPFVGAWLRLVAVMALVWGLLLLRARRSRAWPPTLIGRDRWPGLIAAGLILNVTGNGSFQVALSLGGLALTVPLSQGGVLWGGALASLLILKEPFRRQTALGIACLVLALVALTSGAGEAIPNASPLLVTAAVFAASLSGASYGVGNTLIRRVVSTGVPAEAALAIVSTSGFVALSVIVLARTGLPGVVDTNPAVVAIVLVAGVFNALAFLSLTRALALIAVTRVNAMSGAQTALSALAGVLLFAEPFRLELVIGLGLTVGGLVLIQARPRSPVLSRGGRLPPRR